jgi:hypothetical protein
MLPGGRYACAQELIRRGLPFFGSYCFGQVCHIVQLAISQRKLLGYLDGAVVPYARSQSMLKEHCAAQNQNCPGKSVCPWPTATWDMVRACMREILSSSGCEDTVAAGPPGTMPLSNVKRLFRSRFHMELSETALGYSKLSELLTDTRLQDICTVQLHRQGYVVVPRAAHAEVVPMEPVAWYNADVGMAQCFADACAATPHTPRQPQALCVNETFEFAQPSQTFCVGEPLEFDFEDNDACDGSPGCEAEPLCAITQMKPLKVPASALSPSVLAKDGRIGSCVRNTFIHAAPAPPTPLPKGVGTASRRSRSLPKDMYSVKDEWEGASTRWASCRSLWRAMPAPARMRQRSMMTASWRQRGACQQRQQGAGRQHPRAAGQTLPSAERPFTRRSLYTSPRSYADPVAS